MVTGAYWSWQSIADAIRNGGSEVAAIHGAIHEIAECEGEFCDESKINDNITALSHQAQHQLRHPSWQQAKPSISPCLPTSAASIPHWAPQFIRALSDLDIDVSAGAVCGSGAVLGMMVDAGIVGYDVIEAWCR